MENKIKEIFNSTNNEIKTEDMTVSQNILKFDHTTIQLSNISQVNVGKPKIKIPIIPGIIFVISFFLLFSQTLEGFLFFINFIIVASSAVPLYLYYVNIKKDTKYLILNLNSGRQYSIVFQNTEFADQVRLVIEGAFNQTNQKEVKVSIENQTIHSGDQQNINYGVQKDNTMNSNNTDSSIKISDNHNMSNISIGDNTKNSQISHISKDTDYNWNELKKELTHIISSIQADNDVKKASEEALVYVEKQDKQGFVEFVKAHKFEMTSDLFIALAGTYLPTLIKTIL